MYVGNSLGTHWELIDTLDGLAHARQIRFASNGLLHRLSHNRRFAPTILFIERPNSMLGGVHSIEYCAINACNMP